MHRDLKPSSIYIDDRFRVRIGDFGAARFENCGATLSNGAGALCYIAPEILNEEAPTKKVDVFVFGLILYEILVGDFVFPRERTYGETVMMHVKGYRPKIPDWIHPVVRKVIEDCWAMLPGKRPGFGEVYERMASAWFPFYDDVTFDVMQSYISELEDPDNWAHYCEGSDGVS
jgi:serine/threonine protein kinase